MTSLKAVDTHLAVENDGSTSKAATPIRPPLTAFATSSTTLASFTNTIPPKNEDTSTGDIVAAPISADNAVDPGYDEKTLDATRGLTESKTIDGRPRDVYDKFSKSRKYLIVAIVSYSAFLSRERTLCAYDLV